MDNKTRLVATSRQPINAPWEWLYPLRGLDYEADPSLTNGEIPAAVQLFLQHLNRGGALVAENDPVCAAQVCHLVNGLPLALLRALPPGKEIDFGVQRQPNH